MTRPTKPADLAKKRLFTFTHPQYLGIGDPDKNPATRKEYKEFNLSIHKGQRWSLLSKELGPGVLALIPDSLITQTWLHQTLRNDHFAIWIRLIKRFNPNCITLGQRMQPRVEAASAAKKIPTKRLRLDIVSRAEISAIEDMSTLFDELDEGQITSDNEASVNANTADHAQTMAAMTNMPMENLAWLFDAGLNRTTEMSNSEPMAIDWSDHQGQNQEQNPLIVEQTGQLGLYPATFT